MKFEARKFKDKNGNTIVLRNAEKEDANELLKCMKTVTAETPYLIREPEEFTLTLEQEEQFIQSKIEDSGELLLVAVCNGTHVGNCALMRVGTYKRYAHRCEIAIALYQKYCNLGIGKKMMEAVLESARNAGYEQAELEVISSNTNAIRLYEKMGFQKYGTFPYNMKYKDDSYESADWMMKKL